MQCANYLICNHLQGGLLWESQEKTPSGTHQMGFFFKIAPKLYQRIVQFTNCSRHQKAGLQTAGQYAH